MLFDPLRLFKTDHEEAYLPHLVPLDGELHQVFLCTDIYQFLMETIVDLPSFRLVEFHIDVLQVVVHICFEVSHAQEDFSIHFTLWICLLRQQSIGMFYHQLQANPLGGFSQ
jgi:hypothetical protein